MAKNTIADLDPAAGNNTDVLGQSTQGSAAASTIDNIVQNTLALIGRAYGDIGGMGTVGGTANAITLNSLSTYQTLKDGLLIAIKAPGANTGPATLNLDSLGAKAIRRQGDSPLASDDMIAKGVYLLRYDEVYNTAAGAWVLLNPTFQATSFSQPTLILKQSAAPTPTAEGDIQWDTDDNVLAIGDGAATKLFVPIPASTAAGDIEYFTGAKVKARLAKGAAGQVLRMNAGATAPEWADPTAPGQPIPTSSTFPVGAVAFVRFDNSTQIADGVTTAGSNLKLAVTNVNEGTLSAVGGTQPGTWRNISGGIMRLSFGHFVRIA